METVFQDEEVIEQIDDVETEQFEQVEADEQASEKSVPLHALIKERKKAQEESRKREEAERQLAWERQQKMQPQEEDLSDYENVTRQELKGSKAEVVREVVENLWIRDNPEKFEKVQDYLPTFLKQRPHLAEALKRAPNRYEEAYTLMEALTPRDKKALAKPVTKEVRQAPNNPSGVPKGAALNEAVDVMTMSDAEFQAWRSQQRRKR